jgi:hypothetical protein
MSVMKTQLSFRTIFTGVLFGLLSACATHSPDGHPWATGISTQGPLVGTWTNSLGTVWTIKADGTFDVVNPKRHIWGNYTVAGDTVTIQETGGSTAKGCHGPGVYKFARTAHDTLAFTLVKDACKERIKNVTLTQHLKGLPTS